MGYMLLLMSEYWFIFFGSVCFALRGVLDGPVSLCNKLLRFLSSLTGIPDGVWLVLAAGQFLGGPRYPMSWNRF